MGSSILFLSKDNISYPVDEYLIEQSPVLTELLGNSKFIESETRVIRLPFNGNILKKIIEYIQLKYQNLENTIKIEDDIALDLLECCSFLQS